VDLYLNTYLQGIIGELFVIKLIKRKIYKVLIIYLKKKFSYPQKHTWFYK